MHGSSTRQSTWRAVLAGTQLLAISGVLAASVAPTAVARPAAAEVEHPSWSDFNDDSYSDLAIGAPYDDVNGRAAAGVVHVLYGSSTGLSATDDDLWHQDVSGIANSAEADDHFGWALAAADFNKDGYGDLAIGVPHEDVTINNASVANAGIVHVLWGSPTGLVATDSITRNINDKPSVGGAEFGYSMAALDYRDLDGSPVVGDGYAELAVGAPGYNGNGGGVRIFDGQELSAAADGGGTQDLFGSIADQRRGEVLGGPFESSPGALDWLVIGMPHHDQAGTDAGAVQLVSVTGAINYRQGFNSVTETAEPGDLFGASVAVADIDGDGSDDLVIGAPGEDVSSRVDTGVVHVRWSDPDGTGAANPVWTHFNQAQPSGSNDSAGSGDMFGSSLAPGAYDPAFPGRPYLAIGAPGDRTGPDAAAGSGAVMIMTGNRTTVYGVMYRQGVGQLANTAEGGDAFGRSLTAGNFGLGAADDLVIGVPMEDRAGLANTGIVHVLYGDSDWYAMGATEQVWHQDSSGVLETGQAQDRFGSSLR